MIYLFSLNFCSFAANYRHAIRDCEQAIALKPDYRKAIQRAAESSDKLGSWEELIKWSDKGLMLDHTDKFFVDLRIAAVTEQVWYCLDTHILNVFGILFLRSII